MTRFRDALRHNPYNYRSGLRSRIVFGLRNSRLQCFLIIVLTFLLFAIARLVNISRAVSSLNLRATLTTSPLQLPNYIPFNTTFSFGLAQRNPAIPVQNTSHISLTTNVSTLHQPIFNLSQFSLLRNSYFQTANIDQYSIPFRSKKYFELHQIANETPLPSDYMFLINETHMKSFANGLESARLPASTSASRNLVIHVREGYVYNQRESSKKTKYKLVLPKQLDIYRYPKLADLPKHCTDTQTKQTRPWLLLFTNVWMNGNGHIFVPVSRKKQGNQNEWNVHAYHFQGGGHLISRWIGLKNKHKQFTPNTRCENNVRVAFSIAQYHGSTFYHVMQEVVPRLLTFWNVATEILRSDEGKIVGPKSPVAKSALRSFGVSDNKILQIGNNQLCLFEKLVVPAPFFQGYYNHSCLTKTVGLLQRENVAGLSSDVHNTRSFDNQTNGGSRTKPLVILLERATKRDKTKKRCYKVRCLANFNDLLDSIEYEFGDSIELLVISPKQEDLMYSSIRAFSRATLVVGMHGAGFTNIMFMRGKGTYVIHLGWKVAWQLYAKMAKLFDVDFRNIITKGASQFGRNAEADIPVIILEMRKILMQEGYPLGPPRIRTNRLRNLFLVTKLPPTSS